jgi:hypothetical protein
MSPIVALELLLSERYMEEGKGTGTPDIEVASNVVVLSFDLASGRDLHQTT